ncbi:MAG: putative NRPS-like protein biosynthetic cluster [Vezdaea acicularis]|nr:MAG: putative NRPS-like protein biosynthetic cluster [Vezdaea acicularis]
MPSGSLYPPIDIPEVDIWAFLFENKSRPYPDNKLICLDPDTKRSYTYEDVRNMAIDFGKGLKSLWDWHKNDVLALFTSNCIDTPAIIWGCHWAGGIVSPANPGYTVEELAFQLKDAGAKAVVTQLPQLEVVQAAARSVGIPEDRIILMGDETDKTRAFKHFRSIRNTSETSKYRRSKIDPKKDLAFLVYSSGTTGHPKGVMLSHYNIVANVLMLEAGEEGHLTWSGGSNGDGDRVLAMLPFFHIYGLTCLLHQSAHAGLTLVVMPKFDIRRFCEVIQKNRVTFAYIVPPVVLLLGKDPVVDEYDLSSLRMLNSGAAPLTRELVEAVYRRLAIPIKQGYGLSETSPVTHTQPWELWNTTVGSVGRMLPNQTAKYMSPEEKEVPVGQTGELWIKGPNIFQGYLNNPEGTKNALTPDGYFKTGDVGHQDKDGNFYITDRVKELIKYKGFQVPPAELEGILISNSKVRDVAVIGVYSRELASEVPRAYIVLVQGVEGCTKVGAEISEWLKGRVANHKRLRGGVRFVNEIPKSASGKILRRFLKDAAQKEQDVGERSRL